MNEVALTARATWTGEADRGLANDELGVELEDVTQAVHDGQGWIGTAAFDRGDVAT